jgi:hypothetical protein
MRLIDKKDGHPAAKADRPKIACPEMGQAEFF